MSYRTGILSLCDFISHYYWVYVQLLFSTLARLLSLGTNYRSLQYPIDNTADAMFRKRVRNFKLCFPSDDETLPYTDAQLCVIMFWPSTTPVIPVQMSNPSLGDSLCFGLPAIIFVLSGRCSTSTTYCTNRTHLSAASVPDHIRTRTIRAGTTF